MTEPAAGLSAPAASVLRRAGEQAVHAARTFLDHDALEQACGADGMGHDEVFGALRALRDAGLVDLHFVQPSRITLLRLSDRGIRAYFAGARRDLDGVRAAVLAALRDDTVAWRGGAPVDLAGAVGEAPLLVEVVMEDLRSAGRVLFSRAFGGRLRVHRLS